MQGGRKFLRDGYGSAASNSYGTEEGLNANCKTDESEVVEGEATTAAGNANVAADNANADAAGLLEAFIQGTKSLQNDHYTSSA